MSKSKFSNFLSIFRKHKGLSVILILFTCAHWWLWNHYYLSMWGWVRYFYFFSWSNPSFALLGIFYWLVYSAVFCLAYSHGKKTFIATVVLFLFCITITIPFSMAKVDLSVKFALLLKSNFHWIYLQNYLSWIIGGCLFFIPLVFILGYFLSKTYRTGIVFKKKWRYGILGIFTLIIAWHLAIFGNIDTESPPVPLYDNEIGRVLRTVEALFFYDFNLFSDKELPGRFTTYEGQNPSKKQGVHGVYAFLDTLQYEFLSIHGNPFTPKNPALEGYLRQGILVDFGPVLSCGSHTTASIPSMYSINGCKIGPFFHSELLPHLLKRIGVNNHYVGLEGLSQYFYTVFEEYVEKANKHYITYEETAKALQITAKDLATYPEVPSSLTFVYYDAVHPGMKCSFITGGGLPKSACGGYEHFSTGTAEYPLGMSKAVEVIEKDMVNFIQLSEKNPRPIFLLVTSDHGLSKKFVHGDMADAEISPSEIEEAVQRHTTVLFYGNRAYRQLHPQKWAQMQQNARQSQGWLNHQIFVPSILDGLEISWSESKPIFSDYSIFSTKLKKDNSQRVVPSSYLKKVSLPKM